MVPPSSRKVPRVSRYSGSCRLCLDFTYGAFTLFGWLSQNHSVILSHILRSPKPHSASTVVWALSISLAATLEIDFSFSSSGYLDVSVPRVPPAYLCIQYAVTEVCSARFPHSDIGGSSDICSLPSLFAAYHVLLRLLVPWHPPCALSSLTCLLMRSVASAQDCSHLILPISDVLCNFRYCLSRFLYLSAFITDV